MAKSKNMTPEEKRAVRLGGIKLDKSLWAIRVRCQRLFDAKNTPPDIKWQCLKLLLKMNKREDLLEPESVLEDKPTQSSLADLLGEE
jgi:hypothetical protein